MGGRGLGRVQVAYDGLPAELPTGSSAPGALDFGDSDARSHYAFDLGPARGILTGTGLGAGIWVVLYVAIRTWIA